MSLRITHFSDVTFLKLSFLGHILQKKLSFSLTLAMNQFSPETNPAHHPAVRQTGLISRDKNTCILVVYSYCMKTTLLNYSVIIEPDAETGTNKPVFSAYCPALGIADYGNTIDQALKRIKKTIEFHLECLQQEGEPIPESSAQGILTNVQVSFGGTPSFA